MVYIKENFVPFPDKKMQEQLTRNLDHVYRSQRQLLKIREKQEQNKAKGRQFLEQATKIGREIRQRVGTESTKLFSRAEQVKPELEGSDFKGKMRVSLSSEFARKAEGAKKKRKRFRYHFKKGAPAESSGEESEESRELVIGPTEDFDEWEPEEVDLRAQEFLKELEEKDRLIQAEYNAKFDGQRFRKDDGRKYRRKVDFVVDTIRDKLNFIKNFT